jgi:hypothetical protein
MWGTALLQYSLNRRQVTACFLNKSSIDDGEDDRKPHTIFSNNYNFYSGHSGIFELLSSCQNIPIATPNQTKDDV